MTRILGIAALAVAIWLLSAYPPWGVKPLGLDAPAAQFSAARSDAVLGRILGPQKPHPNGSAEAATVRTRVLAELAALGIQASTQTVDSCYTRPRWRVHPCASVTNIIATVHSGSGRQLVLMAHTDSVPRGPGAADDASGVAIILEAVRALKARGLAGAHPVAMLFTDGEEKGLLGAAAWFRDPANVAATGMVINVEARGNQGPSYLFQTSPGNAVLIDLYARYGKLLTTSSLYGEIYKYLPNDTDLTPALQAGLPGINFAFIGNVADYHTVNDRRENLSPASLQHQGENVLAMADALAHADFAGLKSDDAIYLDIFGLWLPRMPVRWVLPLSLAALLVIALAGWLTPRPRREASRPLLSFMMSPLLLGGAVGAGFALHGLAAWISGHAQPLHPLWLRLSLACGVFAVALPVSRSAGAITSWLWFAILAVACAVVAPGLAPYFLFPALLAAPLLLASCVGGRTAALVVAMLATMVIWISLNQATEPLMGLRLHPLFTLTAAFALIPALPLLREGRARLAAVVAGIAALALALAAGIIG